MLNLYQLCVRAKNLVMPNKPLGAGLASKHPLYSRWAKMIERCYSPTCKSYPDYGGRGIIVCEEWRHNFWLFVDDMGKCPGQRYEIDRIDNDGPYSHTNCRWLHKSLQMQNRRTSVWTIVDGEKLSINELSRRSGVKYHTLKKRLKEGYPLEAAIYVGNIKKDSQLFKLVRARRV